MHKLLVASLWLPLLACSVGPDAGADDDSPDAGGTDAALPTGPQISGNITASATWSGAVDITGNTTIAAGVTVTVAPGAILSIAPGTRILVRGTLDVAGTRAGKITIRPAASSFGGFYAEGGGQLRLSYAIVTGGSISTGTGGTATIVDTVMSRAQGDLLTMDGGTVDMQYSQIGLASSSDTTHCNMHFDGASANTIRVTHSNIGTAAYGLMLYSGTNAVFTNDNWYSNSSFSVHTVAPVAGQPGVTADFTGSWFDDAKVFKAAGTALTGVVLNPALPRNVAGPRP